MSAEPAATRPPARRPVVLVIDDEPPLLALIRRGLEPEYEVETAESAEEAALLAGTRTFDVVVCDQVLPGEQGLEFLTRLAVQQPAVRRILLTGYVNPELLSRGTSMAKLAACLIKPVPPVDLKKAIQTALAAS